MPFIVETGATHPGIKLYVTETASAGRRKAFSMEGKLDEAARFSTRSDAKNAAAQFSSMYGLEIIEVKK